MSGARQRRRLTAHSVVAFLAGIIVMLAPTIPARAQSVAGEAGGVAESGSLSLSNALAGAALDPSTGVLTASLPIDMPPARGGAQPGLALTYNSAAGIREAGVAWGLALPSVERQNIEGPPRYQDPTTASPWPAFDRFVFGGLPLVPICRVKGQTCVIPSGAAVASALPLPPWATEGWVHFRLQTDTSRARFYWSPDLTTWRVQFVSGEILELGQPLVQPTLFGDPADAAIDYDPIRVNAAPVTRRPFRWNPTRRYDAESQRTATNLVVYRWARLGQRERGFLSDVYDTPATDALADRDVLTDADFAHHARLSWDRPPFLRGLAVASFRSTPDLVLSGVDITSQPYDRAVRQMVRRYRLSYLSDGNRYYLKTYEVEGRCAIVAELASGKLPETSCGRLPATRFRYSTHVHNTTPTSFGPALPHAPRAPAAVTLLDVDGDGRPDLLETKEQVLPVSEQKLFFNRTLWPQTKIAGDDVFFSRTARTTTGPINVAPAIAATALWDIDPRQGFVGGAAFATASRDALGRWTWVNGDGNVSLFSDHVLLPGAAPVPPSVVGDIDGDGFADAVYLRSARNEVPSAWPPTWKQTGSTGTVSMGALTRKNNPWPGSMYNSSIWVSACFGPSPNTVQSLEWFGDNKMSASLVDMNGDGFGDLTYVTMTRTAQGVNLLGVRYWPGDGRGNFTACTTDVCACTGNGVDAPSVKFTAFDVGAEAGAQISAENVALGDVNGDGFADLVIVTPDNMRIFWNADGRYWGDFSAQNVTIPGATIATDWKASWPPRISFADVNGNGLTDLVLVVGGQAHFFDSQDPLEWVGGPTRAGLLVGIENGLGATTDIAYTTTAMLARLKGSDEHPWALPQVLHVVDRITVRSGIAGDDAQYAIHDYDNPVYDSRERRFLGFRKVRVSTNLVSTDHSYFIGDSAAAYQGSLLISSEISDKNGRYVSATVRSPLVQDGVAGAFGGYSRAAYDEKIDTLLYDTTQGGAGGGTTSAAVLLGSERIVIFFDGAIPVRTGANARLRVTQRLDDRGNVVEHVDVGRIDEAERPLDDAIVRTTVMYPPRADGKSLPKSVTVAPFSDRTIIGVPADQPRVRRFEYDALGRLGKVFASLTGTLALDRSHED